MAKEVSTFQKLRKALPTGFSRIVTERLAAKGIKTTARNVQYVANGKTRNPDIEAELLDLLDNPPPPKEKPKSDFEKKVEAKLKEKGL
jgi:hypothetical protein